MPMRSFSLNSREFHEGYCRREYSELPRDTLWPREPEVLVETGSKSSPIAAYKATDLALERITTPRESAGTLAVPAGRLGLLAKGESLSILVPETGIHVRLSMNEEGELVIGLDRENDDDDSKQLRLFTD